MEIRGSFTNFCDNGVTNVGDSGVTNIGDSSTLVPDLLWVHMGDVKLDNLFLAAALALKETNIVRLYNEIGDMYKDNDAEIAKNVS